MRGLVVGLRACFVGRPHVVSSCECVPLFVYLFAPTPGYNILHICPSFIYSNRRTLHFSVDFSPC